MANKKRKQSFTVMQKKERAKQEKQQQAKKKRMIIAICSLVLAVIIAASTTIITLVLTNSCAYKRTLDIDDHKTYTATMEIKGCGKVTLLLDYTAAPVTVENFVKLANEGFYDGLTFHRVMDDFMIQGGDPKANGSGGNTDAEGNKLEIKGEFAENGHIANKHLKHRKGVISMARSDDPDSASSQFFICNSNSESVKALDGKYAAFGYVIDGLRVIDKVTRKTAPLAGSNGAISDKADQAVITSIRVVENK